MQAYNTSLPAVKLPEYGRGVQKLVEYCLTIEDREKRSACAAQIVGIMADLYPEVQQVENYRRILWDHLFILSDFKLDVICPYDIIPSEHLASRPEPLNYAQHSVRYRMYGRVVEDLLTRAMQLNDPQQRIRLFELCANHMKRRFHQTNPETEECDDKIIQDILAYTDGQFRDEVYQVFLYRVDDLMKNEQYNPANLVTTPSKKKKKKKKAAAQ
jgi:hypothetical protein